MGLCIHTHYVLPIFIVISGDTVPNSKNSTTQNYRQLQRYNQSVRIRRYYTEPQAYRQLNIIHRIIPKRDKPKEEFVQSATDPYAGLSGYTAVRQRML